MTHYERLQVSPNATTAQIHHAFRSRAVDSHPDRGGSEAEFRHLSEAYHVLRDRKARVEYDRSLVRRRPMPDIEEMIDLDDVQRQAENLVRHGVEELGDSLHAALKTVFGRVRSAAREGTRSGVAAQHVRRRKGRRRK